MKILVLKEDFGEINISQQAVLYRYKYNESSHTEFSVSCLKDSLVK